MPDGNMLIIGNDLDQAALVGLPLCIRDLGKNKEEIHHEQK